MGVGRRCLKDHSHLKGIMPYTDSPDGVRLVTCHARLLAALHEVRDAANSLDAVAVQSASTMYLARRASLAGSLADDAQRLLVEPNRLPWHFHG